MTIYTVMLILSALFMLIAEARRYAPDYWQTSTARPSVSAQDVSETISHFG
jgi:hypothetical protein